MSGRPLFLAVAAMVGCTGTVRAQAIRIWPGPAPGSEHWTQKERTFEHTPVGTVVMNVVTPTLTPYLPERSKATGICSSSLAIRRPIGASRSRRRRKNKKSPTMWAA